ncbi:hypothetical protein [Halobacillus sp. Nhm2S1]|uniref:hypothetical protein n=1 Tax=Halobacillus sp. Nhm2S1 TaxID=2866716 RepID=UPI001C734B90|nr:hypothetical protein [Halobacillus sp. Nhm2S1]MBX0357718.1 hypothetical protein [Halobacillus sp. Nhm2S1]
MKKILIVSYLFAPENQVGSIRATKLAKYLAEKNDYQIEVITTSLKVHLDKSYEKKDYENVNVTELNHSKFIERYIKRINGTGKRSTSREKSVIKDNNKNKHYFNKVIKVLRIYMLFILNIMINLDFYHSFKKHVNANKDKYEDYNVLVSTYGPLTSVLCGIAFKKKHPKISWICDFRDPMVTDLRLPIDNKINSFLQKKACKLADKIVTVSNGYLERICNGKYDYKSYVIPNGFDENDLLDNKSINKSDAKFSFTYTGYLYGGKRDLTPLFKCLSALIKEKVIQKNDLIFNYAGTDYSNLVNQANEFKLQSICVNHGFLTHRDAINLQSCSRFLILSTWNSKSEIGVFPAKFLEYMLSNKPIIAIVNGDLPNSEVSNVMNKAALGFSFEIARYDRDFKALKAYIKEEYLRFKGGMETNFNPNQYVIKRYDYKNIVAEFEEII